MKISYQKTHYLVIGMLIAGILLLMFGVSASNVTVHNLELNSLQKSQMKHLGLQTSEMREFLLKREIYKGYLDTERLSPHEVLGILSEDAAKRRQYARAAAQIRAKLIDSTRNFETLYLQEVSRLTNSD